MWGGRRGVGGWIGVRWRFFRGGQQERMAAAVLAVAAAVGTSRGFSCANVTTSCGGVVPGRGLDEFARRLARRRRADEPPPPHLRILVLGNSVARWNKYHTSSSFRHALQAAFPGVGFTTNIGSVEGGFGPSHQLYCGRGEWKSADIILVHFAELASTAGGSKLLEQVLNLPHAPFVVVVKHCSLPQLEMLVDGTRGGEGITLGGIPRTLWCRRDKHCSKLSGPAPPPALGTQMLAYAQMQWRFEGADLALARRLNATVVDSCALLQSLLRADSGGGGRCGTISSPTIAAPATIARLASRVFPYNAKAGLGDPLHPTTEYSELQGCAAAKMIASAARRVAAAARAAESTGPPSPRACMIPSLCGGVRPAGTSQLARAGASSPSPRARASAATAGTTAADEAAGAPTPWCYKAGDEAFTRAMISNHGWSIRTGGAGGGKRWLHAGAPDADVRLRVPMTTPRLTIEYYKHDALPLGMVNATLSWQRAGKVAYESHMQLDGRCAAADGCPKGQGFYHRAVLADELAPLMRAGDAEVGELRLQVVPRTDGRNGTEFSVVTVVAEV